MVATPHQRIASQGLLKGEIVDPLEKGKPEAEIASAMASLMIPHNTAKNDSWKARKGRRNTPASLENEVGVVVREHR